MSCFGTNRRSVDVLDIAYELRHKLASNPGDMLFSIFGMVDGSWNSSDFKPDYSLSVGQSYDHLQEAVQFCSANCLTPEEHVERCHNHNAQLAFYVRNVMTKESDVIARQVTLETGSTSAVTQVSVSKRRWMAGKVSEMARYTWRTRSRSNSARSLNK